MKTFAILVYLATSSLTAASPLSKRATADFLVYQTDWSEGCGGTASSWDADNFSTKQIQQTMPLGKTHSWKVSNIDANCKVNFCADSSCNTVIDWIDNLSPLATCKTIPGGGIEDAYVQLLC